MEKTVDISITIESLIKFSAFALIILLAYFLSDLFLVILTAIVVASAMEPFVTKMKKKGLPRVPAVILIYISIFLIFFFLVSMLLPVIFDDFFKLFKTIPAYIKSFNAFNYSINEEPARILNAVRNRFADSFSFETLFPGIQMALSQTSEEFVSSAKNFFGGLIEAFLIFVLSFYLLAQEKGIENFLRLVSPLSYEKYILDLWDRSKRKIGYWMQGQIFLGLMIGVFVFLGLTIIGVQNALALAILASIFEIIPVFGPILAGTPSVIMGLIQSVNTGLVVLCFFVIIQQFESNLIYPLVVRKVVGIPPLMVILFLLAGAQIAGILGVIIAVPAAVVIMEIASDFEKRKKFINAEAEAVIAKTE